MNSVERLQPVYKEHIDISFKDIVYEVPVQQINQAGNKTKTILHGVSGIFKAGELNVIMGASGAGKTTLLNILAGRISQFTGQILANNTPYSFDTFGDFANYVMQGDVLMQTMTVRQTLQFAAKLKVADQNEAKMRLANLCKRLKLQKCLDVVVGGPIIKGISGGEKKRTSIAFELMSDPAVVALDEPTSGMDSLTSFVIIHLLRTLAHEGKTIFLTIHQPSSQIFQLFDRLLLMVQGHIIFQGMAQQAETYFSSHFKLQLPQFMNPADYYIQIIHHQDPQNLKRYPQYKKVYSLQIAPAIQKRIEARCKEQIPIRKVQTSFINTLTVLLKRDYTNIIRNPIVMKSRIFQIIFMAVYSGGLYFSAGRQDYNDVVKWHAITGYLFFISMDLFMQSMMPVTITFPLQRMVFLKEQNSKMYGVTSYFMSRNLIEIPYIIIIPMIFQLINYWMIGLGNSAGQFFTMYLIIVLLSFVATSAGMLAGTIVTDQKNISNVINIVCMPLIIFSGFYKNNGNMPNWIGWIRYISPFNYSFTALVQNQTLFTSSPVNQLNFDTSLWASVGILVALGIGFRVLSCFFLWFKKSKLQ